MGKLAEAEEQKREALERLQAMEAERDDLVTARVQEVRDALEKDKTEALAEARAANDAETRKAHRTTGGSAAQAGKAAGRRTGRGRGGQAVRRPQRRVPR